MVKTDGFQPEQYRDYLRVLARALIRSTGRLQHKIDASDVVHDALIQALGALPQFKGATDPEFAGWLRAILANKLADEIRRFGRQKRDAALEQSFRQSLDGSAGRLNAIVRRREPTPSDHVVHIERTQQLVAALYVLSDDQRLAIESHYLDGCSLNETAIRMNRTPASVAGLLRRGLETLRSSLSGREQDLL